MKQKVYSGIRATGRLHLGNYLGAVKGMLELQDRYDCVFSVVDLHAITTPYEKETLGEATRSVILDYLSVGLDPERCLIEVQSMVPEHMELAYYLSTIYPVSRLEDLPTYKDKKEQYPKYVNMGLLYYPVLMAADIMLYKAELIPVGIDQEPHIEVTREIARKFNATYGETFPEPQRFKTPGGYVPSLMGAGKMSKSVEGSFINLTDDLETIKKKLGNAPTDIGKGDKVPETGGVANLLQFVELFEGVEKRKKYEEQYLGDGIRYGDLKASLGEAIFKELEPIQKQRKIYEDDPSLVDRIIREGAEKASKIAKETIKEVKEKMGFI